jgi:hypothetical protein
MASENRTPRGIPSYHSYYGAGIPANYARVTPNLTTNIEPPENGDQYHGTGGNGGSSFADTLRNGFSSIPGML